MSVTMNIPPALEVQAANYERETGETLEMLFVDCLRDRFLQNQKAKGAELVRRLHAIRNRQPVLTGNPIGSIVRMRMTRNAVDGPVL